jgi:hypothetical protein
MTAATPPGEEGGWRVVASKLLIAVVAFATVLGGWIGGRFLITMHTPLPDAGGQQGRCVIWFVGSSSIHRWTTLAADIAPWITHNCGRRRRPAA